jgi:hypothetical protein
MGGTVPLKFEPSWLSKIGESDLPSEGLKQGQI